MSGQRLLAKGASRSEAQNWEWTVSSESTAVPAEAYTNTPSFAFLVELNAETNLKTAIGDFVHKNSGLISGFLR